MSEHDEEQEFVPTAADLEKFQHVMGLLKQLEAATLPHIVALAGIESETEGTQKGSGTIIELGGKVLLLTAAHVIDEIECRFKGVAFSNGQNRPYARTLAPFRKDAALDVAFLSIVRPESRDSALVPVPERLIAETSLGAEDDLLFVHGFPGDDSKYFAMTKGISSQPLAYVNGRGKPKWPHFRSDLHLAIDYDPKYNRGPDGKEALLPKANGMSGAALWNMRRKEVGPNWTSADARIVGVVHRWDQDGRCLIATRIEHVLKFLRGG